MRKKFFKFSIGFLILLIILVIVFIFQVIVSPPTPANEKELVATVVPEKIDSTFSIYQNNWIRKSESGLWEMYVEGTPFELGLINGKLTEDQVVDQEVFFIGQIRKMIPSDTYLNFLKYFVAWFNRDLDDAIPEEYREEIYGVSRAASDDFDFIASKYQRILNYHGAHDIGHALQDKNMVVGCTSFSQWKNDSSFIIGRNFDFYVGDNFAKDKIIAFINPNKGHKFMMVTWGGMIGVVSGMNEHGLTVTINAGKSDIPTSSATPISLVTREILQYASTIEEAYEIAKKRETFVAESIMIGSAKDGQTAIIEKSPTKIDIRYGNENQIICANHFMSNEFKDEESNLKNQKESSSVYRHQRVKELLNDIDTLNYLEVAKVLRDRKGLNNEEVGMGNELALNQLLAHHSIIFQPKQRLVWISTSPFQLGRYIAYDLNKVFSEYKGLKENKEIYEASLTIPTDSFYYSQDYKKFEVFRKLKFDIQKETAENPFKQELVDKIINSNSHSYYAYQLAADYYVKHEKFTEAKTLYNKALILPIPTLPEKRQIEEGIKQCDEALTEEE